MLTRLVSGLAVVLLLVRLPSLVQPMGADQGLYAYVGDRILAGELPYRDAWDQKPPAIHYTYALLRTLSSSDAVVPATDLVAAAIVACLLWRVGATLMTPGAAAAASLLFLLLSNPAFARLGGVRIRAQCETFIALAVTGAFLLLLRSDRESQIRRVLAAGTLFGVAFAFKYNAGVYAPAGLAMLWLRRRLTLHAAATLWAGFAIPLLVVLALFGARGALGDLYDATFTYNLRYAGETYGGQSQFLTYLLTFPVQQARNDALWTLGGAACLLLLLTVRAWRDMLVPVLWVAAACVSIAVNGSRGYPQYFVQANPALALASGVAAIAVWQWLQASSPRRAPVLAGLAIVVIAVAMWRVNQFPKLAEQTMFDIRRATGQLSRDDYLERFADERKYSARSARELGDYLQAHSAPEDAVYVFGFTCGAYNYADRVSASRFFWSRPVIVGFNSGVPGYAVEGLLADLERTRPAVIALQIRDWSPADQDSASFFMSTAPLAGWLQRQYVRGIGPHGFDIWLRQRAAVATR